MPCHFEVLGLMRLVQRCPEYEWVGRWDVVMPLTGLLQLGWLLETRPAAPQLPMLAMQDSDSQGMLVNKLHTRSQTIRILKIEIP